MKRGWSYNEQLRRSDTMAEDIFLQLQQMKQKQEMVQLIACNKKTEKFGLALTEENTKELILCRNESLKKYRRVEFGNGILDKVIFVFCDSQYIIQDNYVEILKRLQDIFYEFKNEALDKLSDDELLTFMREQFETICFGDLDYLETTCLERFAAAIRGGYRGYEKTGGSKEYEKFDTEQRWDNELYYEVVKEIFW